MSDSVTSPPVSDAEILKKIRQTARTMQNRFDELAKRYDIEELLRQDALACACQKREKAGPAGAGADRHKRRQPTLPVGDGI